MRGNLGEFFLPFLVLWHHQCMECILSQVSPYRVILLCSASSAGYSSSLTPPSHKKVSIPPQTHYLKSGMSGTFSACKCIQFESPGWLFHLLWYAYLIHCPRLDLIWCLLVQGWWWAASEGPRERVVFSFLSAGPLFWSTGFLVVLFAHEMLRTFQLIGYE